MEISFWIAGMVPRKGADIYGGIRFTCAQTRRDCLLDIVGWIHDMGPNGMDTLNWAFKSLLKKSQKLAKTEEGREKQLRALKDPVLIKIIDSCMDIVAWNIEERKLSEI